MERKAKGGIKWKKSKTHLCINLKFMNQIHNSKLWQNLGAVPRLLYALLLISQDSVSGKSEIIGKTYIKVYKKAMVLERMFEDL